VPFFGAFGIACGDAIERQSPRDVVARDGCHVGNLRGGNVGPPAVARRPLVVVALGQSRYFTSSGPTGARRGADGQRDDREAILDNQQLWPWRKKVTQGTLPVGKSISGGGSNEGKPGDGDRVPSGDKKRGIVRTLGGVKGGRNATCSQSRDRPCKSRSRRRAVA
jgi:hypothetical protein